MRKLDRLVVALSGGVDSSVVAALAYRALGERALAVTAVGETLAARELEAARAVAREIGIEHRLLRLSELAVPGFRANGRDRCFFCQALRFDQLRLLAREVGCSVIAAGTQLSDLGEHRPGLEAMRQRSIYQPLLEQGLDKQAVRALARWLGLSVWDKPSQPCLSSRIAHGIEVTDERLRRVERAEEALHRRGLKELRVRDRGDRATVEIGAAETAALGTPRQRDELLRQVAAAGFPRVELDPRGLASGRLSAEAEEREKERKRKQEKEKEGAEEGVKGA